MNMDPKHREPIAKIYPLSMMHISAQLPRFLKLLNNQQPSLMRRLQQKYCKPLTMLKSQFTMLTNSSKTRASVMLPFPRVSA